MQFSSNKNPKFLTKSMNDLLLSIEEKLSSRDRNLPLLLSLKEWSQILTIQVLGWFRNQTYQLVRGR